jgi:hypothetical protein
MTRSLSMRLFARKTLQLSPNDTVIRTEAIDCETKNALSSGGLRIALSAIRLRCSHSEGGQRMGPTEESLAVVKWSVSRPVDFCIASRNSDTAWVTIEEQVSSRDLNQLEHSTF